MEKKVKEKFGLRTSTYYPITAQPENAHPTYGEKIDMGCAVKAYMTTNFAENSLYGDDVSVLDLRRFISGQLDAETLLNDLEVESKIFGSTYDAATGLVDNHDDTPKEGGYSYVQMLRTKTEIVYRAVFLYRVIPRLGNDNSDTNGSSLNFTHNAITYTVMADNTGAWRNRLDFKTLKEATDFLESIAAGK
jgi:hypothetical protein